MDQEVEAVERVGLSWSGMNRLSSLGTVHDAQQAERRSGRDRAPAETWIRVSWKPRSVTLGVDMGRDARPGRGPADASSESSDRRGAAAASGRTGRPACSGVRMRPGGRCRTASARPAGSCPSAPARASRASARPSGTACPWCSDDACPSWAPSPMLVPMSRTVASPTKASRADRDPARSRSARRGPVADQM